MNAPATAGQEPGKTVKPTERTAASGTSPSSRESGSGKVGRTFASADAGTAGRTNRGAGTLFKVRAGQREFERGVDEHRITGLLARRQFGKTTIASRIALKKMMRSPGHTVVFGSIKLDLGREIVRKEAEAMQRAIGMMAAQAADAGALLDVVELGGKSAAGLGADDFADLYEHQRLEFRLYHSRSIYSRTKVVALTPEAVGETGDLILDEVGRVKRFREVWEAVKPIIASQPQFRCVLTTTPPPDDTHYSFELLAPPIGQDFAASPVGNWYRSELGVWVLRITAWDAWADGVPLYDDDTGEPIDPDTARRKDPDKEAWDRNYGVQFVLGGTAACGLLQMDAAQRRGIGQCACIVVHEDADFERALEFLAENLTGGPVGLGWDLATTESKTSNPSSFTVTERLGMDMLSRLVCVWKTADPALALERARRLVETVNRRESGGRARRLCVDASNERYFAADVQRELGGLVPVELVLGGQTIERPGHEPMTAKAWLGAQYVGELDDNHLTLPPERYLREDHRRVKRDRGTFACEVGPNGEHGDTFDSGKLSVHALTSTAGAIGSVQGIRLAQAAFRPQRLGVLA